MKIELTDFEWDTSRFVGQPPHTVPYYSKESPVITIEPGYTPSEALLTISGIEQTPIKITNLKRLITALQSIATILLLLFLLPSLVHGQAVIVGEFPIPEKIKEAKYTLAAAEPKVLALNVGEFEIIEPAKTLVNIPLYWHVSDSSIMQQINIPANQGYGLWMKRRGEPEAKLHLFPARPVAWVILVGAKQGVSSIAIIRNGLVAASDPPTVVDSVAVTVGTPKPHPPPPDQFTDFEKALKKALDADVAANKGQKAHAELLAGIYRGAANSLPSSLTAGELYTTLQRAIASAGIPAPSQSLPTMRALIATELNKRLPTESDKQLTLEDRNRITATFGAMADALEAILK